MRTSRIFLDLSYDFCPEWHYGNIDNNIHIHIHALKGTMWRVLIYAYSLSEEVFILYFILLFSWLVDQRKELNDMSTL